MSGMVSFDDIVKTSRILKANALSQKSGWGDDYFIGVISPTYADEIMTFWSPKEAWKYDHWRRRYLAWLDRTGKKAPIPLDVSEFKMGWRR